MTTGTRATLGLTILCLALAQGCKPPQQYAWGSYESSLYRLAKDPTSFEDYGAKLLHQIQNGEAARQVPPGIYAEYGFFLLVSNKKTEAVLYFQKEKDKWPEAILLMDRMIKMASDPVSLEKKS